MEPDKIASRDRRDARVRDGRDSDHGGRRPSADPADALFTPIQQRVLGLLFGQPDRRFRSSDVVRLGAAGRSTVHRLLTRLIDAGLIAAQDVGNQTLYQANRASPVFAELHGLIVKTSGLIAPLRAALGVLDDRIDAAFVYGPLIKGADEAVRDIKGADEAVRDIDLIVIADKVDYAEAVSALKPVEAMLGRTINPNVIGLQEWRRKRKQHGLVARIATQPRLFVLGSEDDIR